jgi:hypothetical protein
MDSYEKYYKAITCNHRIWPNQELSFPGRMSRSKTFRLVTKRVLRIVNHFRVNRDLYRSFWKYDGGGWRRYGTILTRSSVILNRKPITDGFRRVSSNVHRGVMFCTSVVRTRVHLLKSVWQSNHNYKHIAHEKSPRKCINLYYSRRFGLAASFFMTTQHENSWSYCWLITTSCHVHRFMKFIKLNDFFSTRKTRTHNSLWYIISVHSV